MSIVTLAGDLDVFSRTYGIEQAIEWIGQRAGARYPGALVEAAAHDAARWLAALDHLSPDALDAALATPDMQGATSAELIADVIDLKLPWMTGFSRSVAVTAAACYERLSPDAAARERVYRAGLIHGIGRAAVPNDVWNLPTRLPASAWEKCGSCRTGQSAPDGRPARSAKPRCLRRMRMSGRTVPVISAACAMRR